jgi:hypothetical protein
MKPKNRAPGGLTPGAHRDLPRFAPSRCGGAPLRAGPSYGLRGQPAYPTKGGQF